MRQIIAAFGVVCFVLAIFNAPKANWLAAGIFCWYVIANWGLR